MIFRKGQNPRIDSYSRFFDNDQQEQGIDEHLREQGLSEVCVEGLATDYCIRSTAADAAELDFPTTVILDETRGVNLQKGAVGLALAAPREHRVLTFASSELP
jgi:nicotinamidase/pyrazinamidase